MPLPLKQRAQLKLMICRQYQQPQCFSRDYKKVLDWQPKFCKSRTRSADPAVSRAGGVLPVNHENEL